MKAKRFIKGLITILIILTEICGAVLLGYSLYLYKGIETFYRIYIIVILVYLSIFTSYLLLRSLKKKKKVAFVIPFIIGLIICSVEFVGFYYLKNVYKAIDSYSNTENMYYSSLVTYDLTLNSEKDLKNKTIGIVNDTSDIEGNILPLETISNLKLEEENTIKKYDSTMELLYALKNKNIDAAFFSGNYVDMFYSLDGYEDIEEETKVLYTASKEYDVEDTTSSETASLTEPFTMLLIGVDSSKDGVTSGYNGDVLLLVTFNPNTLKATITSIPRDMYLKTACSNGSYRRINTTTWGSSSSCAVNTVENLFDVDIDYYAKINFKGVVSLVDAVGGIDVDVPYSLCEQNSSRKWGKNTVYVEKGKQHLNGEQALALARNRHSAKDSKKMQKYCPTYTEGSRSDYTRGKNQIKVIMGVVNAATKLKDPNDALSILQTISKNFQTNIKTKDVTSLYNLGKSIILTDNSNLVNVQRSQLSGYSVYGSVYEPASKSYPAVTIPYNGSINDIKEQIQINLGKKKATTVKKVSFDINNLFKDTVVGSGSYSQSRIATLANVSSYSVSKIKSYASSNGLKLKFIDKSTNSEVSISDWSEYKFSSQKEHKDTILDQLSSLTIYVTKRTTTSSSSNNNTTSNNTEESTNTENNNTENTSNENTNTENTNTES